MQRLSLKISQIQVKIPHTMTAEAFCQLNDESREDILTLEGTHIGQREVNGLFFDLYQVQGFYVEFCYHLGRNSKVTTHIFDDTDQLDPYLSEDVSFPSLVRLASS